MKRQSLRERCAIGVQTLAVTLALFVLTASGVSGQSENDCGNPASVVLNGRIDAEDVIARRNHVAALLEKNIVLAVAGTTDRYGEALTLLNDPGTYRYLSGAPLVSSWILITPLRLPGGSVIARTHMFVDTAHHAARAMSSAMAMLREQAVIDTNLTIRSLCDLDSVIDSLARTGREIYCLGGLPPIARHRGVSGLISIDCLDSLDRLAGTSAHRRGELSCGKDIYQRRIATCLGYIGGLALDESIRLGWYAQHGFRLFEIAAIVDYNLERFGVSPGGRTHVIGRIDSDATAYDRGLTSEVTWGNLIIVEATPRLAGETVMLARTFAPSGHFNSMQFIIHQIVEKSLDSAVSLVVPGMLLGDIQMRARRILEESLKRLLIGVDPASPSDFIEDGQIGIISNDGALIVDPTIRLEEGDIVGIGAGVYIPIGSSCPPKWHGIGVKICDSYIVERQGASGITTGLPRNFQEMERLASGRPIGR